MSGQMDNSLCFCPQSVVQTVDNLLGPEALVAWADLSGTEQSRSASLLLDAVEKGAFLLANNLYESRFSYRAPNVGTWSLAFSLWFVRHRLQLNTARLLCISVSVNGQIWRCMC